MPDSYSQAIQKAATCILGRSGKRRPKIGIILGSGLGNLGSSITELTTIPYADIPGFPIPTAIGHKGQLLCGKLGGTQVVAMQGRFHWYEGITMQELTFPVRVMAAIGIQYLFVSNAAGGVNPDYQCGDIMIITDHISLLPNPLVGPNMETLGPRFPDMTAAYDLDLIERARKIAAQEKIDVREGVYLACSGPCYETPAEYEYFKRVGADVVGMSTTPEVIVARHMGIKVFGVSVVTDVYHPGEEDYVTDPEMILREADKAAEKMTRLFRWVIRSI